MADSALAEAFAIERVADLIERYDAAEVWAPISGWSGYQVSSWGQVRGPRKMLKPSSTHGYQHVSLSGESGFANYRVHRLVAETFLGPPPFDGAVVAHNDGDQTNNRVGNLRWASALENQADRERHDTRCRGSDVRCAKLVESDIPLIRSRIEAGEIYDDIAADYGVSKSTISLIKRRRIWTHV